MEWKENLLSWIPAQSAPTGSSGEQTGPCSLSCLKLGPTLCTPCHQTVAEVQRGSAGVGCPEGKFR